MRLLIADDEPLQRYNLRSMAKEALPDLEIIEAANGAETVKILSEAGADAAFVDVRMPKMDGLEAMRRLRDSGTAVPWVVMTSHSEFSYAKQALELGALAYALKPPSPEEVRSLLDKLAESCKRGRDDLVRSFEHAWAVDAGSDTEFPSILPGLLVVDDGAALGDAGGVPALRQRVLERARHFASPSLTAVMPGTLPGSLEIAHTGDPGFWNEVYAAAPGKRALCLVAELAETPSEARSRLPSLRSIAAYRALLPAGVIGTRSAAELMAAFSSAELTGAAAAGRIAAAAVAADRTAFRDAAVDLESVSDDLDDDTKKRLLRFLERALGPITGRAETGGNAENAGTEGCGTDNWSVTLKALRAGPQSLRFGPFPGSAAPSASAASGSSAAAGSSWPDDAENTGDAIASVERYLRRHFADRITLAKTAELFSLTPNYLSTLFHQRMGETFVDFVTARRMEKAQSLLKGGKSVKETAWAVGYGSERHFAQLYRKRFGVLPAAEKNAKS